jgi:hypothetical protein
VSSATDPDLESLKAANRRLEAKLAALIERSPVLRRAAHDMKMAQLKARANELDAKAFALRKAMRKKPEFMYLPGGLHEITPLEGERVEVLVDESTAFICDIQRRMILFRGRVPFFDFDHQRNAVAFLPERFFWRDDSHRPGVYVRGSWRAACESKNFVAFSPVFLVDDNTPARVTCCPDANPNMGGFTNSPAFGSKLTLRVNDNP